MEFARTEDVLKLVNDLEHSEPNVELVKLACFNANATVINKLFEQGTSKPKMVPDDLRVAACYYAVADVIQTFSQPDDYKYRDYITKADNLVRSYIGRADKVSGSPYTSSKSPLPQI